MTAQEPTAATLSERPWEELAELLESAPPSEVAACFHRLPSEEVPRVLSRLDVAEQCRLFAVLSPEAGARVLQDVPEIQAPELLEHLAPETAAGILKALPSDERADLIGALERDDAEAILELLHPREADAIRDLAGYDVSEAGGLMITEFLAYPAAWTNHQVMEDLREHLEDYGSYEMQYLYVVGPGRRLVGVVPLRRLLLAPRQQEIGRAMIRNPVTVPHHARLEEIQDIFDAHAFLGLPVVAEGGILLGVLTRRNVQEALSRRADSDFLKRQGMVEEELRSMPLWRRSRGRLAWLSVNILLNIVAASVIALHQDTLQAVIALAVFLPIISDMSGCSGNQAVAVSMRELSLGVVHPREVLHVLWKEVLVGLINGVALGGMIGAVAWLWKSNPYLGLVVGTAMALNTLLAVCIGGVVPLLIKRAGRDPALASGPILTTITDLCGFMLILTLASLLLPHLT
jgi:magnesium transporter